jgi:hypothetical protein
MLLLAMMLPCAIPAVAESLASLEAETETLAEICQPCVSIVNVSRLCRKQLLARRVDATPFACRIKRLHSPAESLAVRGHRLSQEQLAPLIC